MPGPVQRSNSQLGLLTGQMDSGKMPLYDAKPAKAGGLRRWASEAQVQALLALALLLLVAGCWTATRPLQTASPVLLQSHVSMASGDPKQVLGEGARLLLVQAVFRHGARTPLSQLYWPATEWHVCPRVYPGVGLDIRDSRGAAQPPPVLDPVMPALPGGNCTMGTLTTAGYQQALALGSYLRSRYVAGEKLLSGDYEPSAVFAHTTSMRRTIATLRGVLSGLYPSDAAKGTSVLVNATAEPHNFMYAKNTSCAAVGPILEELWRQAEDAGGYRQSQAPPIGASAAQLTTHVADCACLQKHCYRTASLSNCLMHIQHMHSTETSRCCQWPRGRLLEVACTAETHKLAHNTARRGI